MVGIVGMNLVWACGSIELTLPQKVSLMLCCSVANQGSIFRWSRDHRAHLKNLGTELDPYYSDRGGFFSYMGYVILQKTQAALKASKEVDVADLVLDQVVMFQADVDVWWNLSFCHAVPAFITMLWGEELFLGWIICGCTRYVLALHANLLLVHFQHLWGPTTIKEELGTQEALSQESLTFARQVSEEAVEARSQPSMWRSNSSLDLTEGVTKIVGENLGDPSQADSSGRPAPLGELARSQEGDSGPVFVKYNVRQEGDGDPSVEVKLEPLWRRSTLVDLAKDCVADILGIKADAVKPDRPLMDLGFDSNGALKLREKLQRRLKVDLPPTLLFNFPTINEMVDHGLSTLAPRPTTPAATAVARERAAHHTPDLAVVSTACQIPFSYGTSGYWETLSSRTDAVVEVPLARWDNELYYSSEPTEGKTYCRHAGFIEGADLFDTSFFGMSNAEARATDPQQRLLLHTAYQGLQGNGYDKATLAGSELGVFVALSNLDWYHMSLSKPSVFTGPGVASSIAANRVSFSFGLTGPSMTVDTACSSSISAMSAAMHCLVGGGAVHEALVAATELLHGPNSFVLRSVAGMLSGAGRCKTFNATADGYIRGEGAGAGVITHLRDAEDGRCTVLADVKSAVMNQDGKSATLTAPNGPAQEKVVLQALRDGGVESASVAAIECHGTGTELGDPIEVGALKAVLGTPSAHAPELYLCAGKSNHGHLEGAAGFAGMLKVWTCLQHLQVTPNVHYAALNPHMSIDNSRLVVPESVSALPEKGAIMGVSSFGFGGTNAHAMMAQPKSSGPQQAIEHKIAFLFTGMGSQQVDMGKRLYKTNEVFRSALDQCRDICKDLSLLQENLLDVMFPEDREMATKLETTLYSQVAIFSLEYALGKMWSAQGIVPYAVMGHSVGEFAAAVYAGVMSVEDGLRLMAARGHLTEKLVDQDAGCMTSIFASWGVVQAAIEQADLKGGVAVIAAINGPSATMVSGTKAAVASVCENVKANHVTISTRHAFHSPLLEPILPELREAVASCKLSPPTACKMVSILSGSEEKDKFATAAHWVGHDEPRPMLFLQGMETLERMGCTAFVEIGPQPVLVKMGRRCVGERADGFEWLASIQPGRDDVQEVLRVRRALGATAGARPSELKPVAMPWRAPLLHPLLGAPVQEGGATSFSSDAPLSSGPAMQLFQQHCVFGEVVLPGASHILLAAAARLVISGGFCAEVTDAVFERPFLVPEDGGVRLHCRVSEDGTEVSSSPKDGDVTVHARFGQSRVIGLPASEADHLPEMRKLCGEPSPDCIKDLYASFDERGLGYGPSFQVLRECAFSKDGAVARLGHETTLWERCLQLLHPALLDGALQLLVESASRQSETPATYLPFAVKRAVVAANCPSGELWATVRILESTATSLTANVEVVSADGKLACRLEGASCRRAEGKPQEADGSEGCLYSREWIPAPQVAGGAHGKVLVVSGRSDAIQAVLGLDSTKCAAAATIEDALKKVDGELATIVLEAAGEQVDALDSMLRLVQAVTSKDGDLPRVVLVTTSAQAVKAGMDVDPEHSGIWGFARALRLEITSLPVTCVDLSGGSDAGAVTSALLASEAELGVRGGEALTSRLARSDVVPKRPLRLQMARRGSLQNLRPVPQTERKSPSAGDIEVRVKAIGLNFRDVLNVMGLYPGDPGEPGLDCSGTVVNMGEGLEKNELRCGDTSVGIVWGCLKTYASTKAQLLVPQPDTWTPADAAALPTVYTTVDVAFRELAKLKKGERVLIHAATGGVGLVAVQYAQRMGAIVYATAGKKEKQDHLRGLGVQYITSSRNDDEFEADMLKFLGKEKIDVCLNSMSHLGFIPRSLRLLKNGGRFVEIGKRDVWTVEEVKKEFPTVDYHLLAIDYVCEFEPDRYQGLLKRLQNELQGGSWKPLPVTCYEGLETGVAAMSFLQRAAQIGKVVLTAPPRMGLKPAAGYVLSGGMGALGVVTAQAMAEEGAKCMVLLSRSGKAAAEVESQWKWLQASSADVLAWKCDIGDAKSAESLKKQLKADLKNPVHGALHLAGILDDALVPQLTRGHFERGFAPKVGGARHLHNALAGAPLDFLVVYSSTAALLGAAGQANYSSANACLDGLAQHWRHEGQPAQSVQWGPWLSVGMAAQNNSFQRLKLGGISNELGLSVLSAALDPAAGGPVLGCALVQWPGYLKQFPNVPSYFSKFRGSSVAASGGQAGAGTGAEAAMMSPESVVTWISSVAADVVGSEVALDEPLMAAGMDSLSSVEFRNRLSAECNFMKFPNTLMFDHPTLRAVSALVTDSLAPIAADTAAPATAAPKSAGDMRVVSRGLACRFPGGDGVEEGWSRWVKKTDSVIEIPYMRWDVLEYFNPDQDAGGNFMYARHGGFVEGAELFDAQHFGMSGAEAKTIDPQQRFCLEVAFWACHSAGVDKGQLLGSNTGVFVGQCNHDWAKSSTERGANPYTGPGTHGSITSNRVSYSLGLRGPSASVDTACSSSLVALDIAANKVHVDLPFALCVGVQLNLIPEPFIAFSKARMLSPDGRCKTFDDSANGYARGEGCGALHMEAAKNLTDSTLPEVGSTMTNQDGRSSTLTAPNGPAQQEVVRRALQQAGVAASLVNYVECHGTGTALGDPIEVGALKGVLSAGRSSPVVLGTVKTNIGHLEGAAGIAGLVKCMQTLVHREAPPNVHFGKLNHTIELDDFQVIVPTSMTPLEGTDLSAGLSSFGFGGTNAHVIFKHSTQATKKASTTDGASVRQVGFLFTGQGSQYVGMGKQLYEADATFRATLDACAKLLDPLLKVPLLEVMFEEKAEQKGLLDQTEYSQPAIFSVEVSLAAMWKAKGVQPSAVLGHSVGEYAAAVATGVMSLEDAARLIAARGRLIQEKCEAGVGGMVAVFAPEEAVNEAIGSLTKKEKQDVAIAGVNGPKLCVVSGRSKTVTKVVEATGAGNRALNVSHGFHSPLMAPMLAAFRQEVSKVNLSEPKGCRFVSTVTGKEVSKELSDPEYWVNHVERTVRFADGMAALEATSLDVFLEVGPEPTLVKMGKRCVQSDKSYDWLSSLEARDGAGTDEQSVAEAEAVIRGGLAPLKYKRSPFPWRDAGPRMLRRRGGNDKEVHFDVPVRSDLFAVAGEHVVYSEIVVPGVVFVEMATEATRAHLGDGVQLRDVQMVWPLVVPKDGDCDDKQTWMRLAIIGNKKFELRSQGPGDDKWTVHCEGKITISSETPAQPEDEAVVRARCPESVDSAKLYPLVDSTGLWLGPKFQVISGMVRSKDEISCRMQLAPDVTNVGYVIHPSLFDGTIHAVCATMFDQDPPFLKIFAGVGKVQVFCREAPKNESVILHLRIDELTEQQQIFTCTVHNEAGVVLWVMENVIFRKVLPEQIQKALEATKKKEDVSFFDAQWMPVKDASDELAADSGTWLVLAEDKKLLEEMSKTLGSRHTYGSALSLPDDLYGFTKIISVAAEKASHVDVLEGSVKVLQRVVGMEKTEEKAPPEVFFVLQGTQAADVADLSGAPVPMHAGVWGMSRCLRLEHPDALAGCIELGGCGGGAADLVARLRAVRVRQDDLLEPEIVLQGASSTPTQYVARLAEVTAQFPVQEQLSFDKEGSYAVSGGTGGLGLLFGRWMADHGAGHLALLSRSGKAPPESSAMMDQLQALGGVTVSVQKCDVQDAADVKALFKSLKGVKGVIHAAGVLDDHLIVDLERQHFEKVLKPKVDGTLNLSAALESAAGLDFFALFSSIAAMLGSPGQANYCSGNAFMDSYALHRRAQGHSAVSVQWGPWAEVGMAARAGTSETSYQRIPLAGGLAAMGAILGTSASVVGVARVNWSNLLAGMATVPAYLQNFKSFKKAAVAAGASISRDLVSSTIQDVLCDVLGDPDLADFSVPLMDMGLDSLSAVEFRNRVQASFDGLTLTATVMFDYPTVADLSDFIVSQFGGGGEEGGEGGAARELNAQEALAMLGVASRFPGCKTNTADEYWSMLIQGKDMISEVPIERWDVDEYYDEDPSAAGKMYARNGGFITGLGDFDAKMFGILDLEAQSMDPHQRILLEVVYESLWHSGFSKDDVSNSNTGSFIGCATLGGISVLDDDIGPYTNIGSFPSGNSGRVSHALGLRGPCFTIDTACSATLVALDCAAQASRLGKTDKSVVAGSNLQLCPNTWVGFCKMSALSVDGRCKTFDASANGFTRSEGAGSCITELVSTTERRGKVAVCQVIGTCVNQDGRSATITAPSGPAQQRCINSALADASVDGEEISMVEVHGTGTALGDPIEIGGLKSTVGKGRSAGDPVILAAAKSIIGHEEGAAGIAGIVKMVASMQHKQIPKNLHLKQLNPNIDLDGFAVIMPDSLIDWRPNNVKAGTSSYGFSGTNSHSILEGPKLKDGEVLSLVRADPLPWNKTPHRLLGMEAMARKFWYALEWRPQELTAQDAKGMLPCLVVGNGDVARALQKTLDCDLVESGAGLSAKLKEQEWATLVFAEALSADDPTLEGSTLADLLELCKASMGTGRSTRLAAVTIGAQSVAGGSIGRGVVGSAIWGFVRTLPFEAPGLKVQSIDLCDVSDTDAAAQTIANELSVSTAGMEAEVAYIDGVRKVPRLATCPVPQGSADIARPEATQLVTGGLGGLGLLCAQSLADLGSQSLVLVSRKGRVPDGEEAVAALLENLKKSSATVHAWACDVSDAKQVSSLTKRIGQEMPSNPLGGVVHSAGVLDFIDIQSQSPERWAPVFKAKVSGAWNLHEATEGTKLNNFVLFSSVSAFVGLSRGTSYSSSNAYLDGLALWRRAQGLPATALQWGPVAEVGMSSRDSHGIADSALKLIKPSQVQKAFSQSLFAGSMPASLAFARVDWGQFQKELGIQVPVLQDYDGEEKVAGGPGGGVPDAFKGLSADQVQSQVSTMVAQIASGVLGLELEELSLDAPLMEAGLDSLSSVDFRNQVAKKLPGLKMPSTLMFDYPNTREIASFAASMLAPADAASAPQAAGAPRASPTAPGGAAVAESTEPVGIWSGAYRFPVDGTSLGELWAALDSQHDGVTEIPFDRWDVDAYYSADQEEPGKMYVRPVPGAYEGPKGRGEILGGSLGGGFAWQRAV
ncbi:unnamed protein product [Prorocentrum cordatum]|uniref:Uncharacterized protein n=1 Tax=Prorocentrum cordatum TaxID=2364126 RepID=A0ABN9W5Z2_9DINO|nr:unnamed protein product [Polarella glacialis]